MTGLGGFLPEEQDLLIGIFFRVGYWISHVDDTDISDRSEEIEQKQLINALNKIASSKKTTELVRELAEEAARRSGDQARWLRNEDHLMGDIAKAVKLVDSQGSDDDFQFFKKSIMFAATAVARAYREEPENNQSESRLNWLIEKASSLLTSVSDHEAYKDMNISPAEDSALHELAGALSGR
jgi:hypothetical protein